MSIHIVIVFMVDAFYFKTNFNFVGIILLQIFLKHLKTYLYFDGHDDDGARKKKAQNLL